jgi:uncharacterized protein
MSDTHASPFAKVHSLPSNSARWTRGFWGDRFACCRDAMVPAMGELMCKRMLPQFLGNFRVAAGKIEGRHRGPKWNDGDFYKWLEAGAHVYAVSKDPKLDEEMDRLIFEIAVAQEPDGYIHTDVQIAQRAGQDAKRFGNPMDFEMYNMGHLMSTACAHHRATGKSNFLNIARKAADCLARVFASPTRDQARHGICPSHLMGLVELYRTTGQKRYLDLAVKLLNMRDLVANGDDDNQDRISFRQQTTAHGHAVRATYLYAGAADIYIETGDESLRTPLEPIWRDLVSKKLYITGGCGALFDGASPDGSEDQAGIRRVHQAFGRNYQLPNSTAHNETCAAIGNLLWNWRMFLITGEARFADVVELTLLNSVLAGVSLDGTAFFYTNTLRNIDPMPVADLRWPRTRQKSMSCFCCPPNVARTIARSSEYAYAVSNRGVYCVLYGSSELQAKLDRTQMKLKQETDYPWDGRVRITIQSAGEFSLMLRIPAWAQGASIESKAHGSAVSLQPGTFHELRAVWKPGDVIDLNLPMTVRLVEANPYVEESRNHLAVMRGPLVYCLESIDLPKGVRVLNVMLPREVALKPVRADAPLDAMVALQGRAKATASSDWTDTLYREIASETLREVDIKLIPYFAWDNRGKSEMTVWIPVLH